MTVNEFRRRIYELAQLYPRLERGGLNAAQLRDLVRSVARRRGWGARVTYRPWPWPGTTQLIGDSIEIVIDSRRNPAEQVLTLAHEAGHVCLGHLDDDVFCTELDGPYSREQDEWADLFASIILNRRLGPLDYLGKEQFELF